MKIRLVLLITTLVVLSLCIYPNRILPIVYFSKLVHFIPQRNITPDFAQEFNRKALEDRRTIFRHYTI